jgi:SAM-dependent methyltransferase
VGFDFWARGATPGVLRLLRTAGIDTGLVVELGCGSGIAAEMLVEAGYGVFGVDVSETMVDLARARVPSARFVHGSLHDVELPPCVAVVAMGEILSYAGITDELLRRVRGALSPGGLLVFDVATPGRGTPEPDRVWSEGDGWLLCREAVEDVEGRRLTREIALFVRDDDGRWRRSDEVHTLSLHDPPSLIERLAAAGFADAAVLEDGYGPQLKKLPGLAVITARAP